MGGKGRKRPSRAERRRMEQRQALRRRIGYGIGAVVAVGIVLGFVLTSPSGDGEPSPAREVRVSGGPRSEPLAAGEVVPDFSAPDLEGGTFAWSDYQGRPTVLAVWAAWCPHCQKELPVLADVAADHPDVELVSVVTSIGQQPGPTPEEYMAEEGLTFPVAVDDAKNTLGQAFGIQSFPTTYWVGADGKVVQVTVGETQEEQMRSLFSALAETAA